MNSYFLARVLAALIAVESDGDMDAVGACGGFGPLQITPIMVRDVNRIAGTNYQHEDAFHLVHACAMARVVFEHYDVQTLDDAVMFWRHSTDWRSTPLDQTDIQRIKKAYAHFMPTAEAVILDAVSR